MSTNVNASLYVGVYGNCGYGNISVATNTSTGTLQLLYSTLGQWNLYEKDTNHTFIGEGIGDSWYFYMNDVSFDSLDVETGQMDRLIVTSFEPRDPPVFQRDADLDSCQ